jgi:hypothetical protein
MTKATNRPEGDERDMHAVGEGAMGASGQMGMQDTQSMPEVAPTVPDPFPVALWWGMGWGALAGLLLGLLFAWLLTTNVLKMPSAGGLWSSDVSTFYLLWAIVGATVGWLAGGLGAIWATKV